MTLDEALSHITDRLTFVPPGPEALEQMSGHRKRSFNLSDLKIVEKSYDLNIVRLCAWCGNGKLPTRRHKYCSPACSDSAYIYCNPQSPGAKGYILVELQNCACR